MAEKKAISTYKTYLMVGSGTGTVTYSKLVDIKNFPDLGGDPELIDVTTLSDRMRHYILGILDTGLLSIDYNYTPANYAAVDAVCDEDVHKFSIWFGATTANHVDTPDGSLGKFDFDAVASQYVTGGGVNEAVNGRISLGLQSDIIPTVTTG